MPSEILTCPHCSTSLTTGKSFAAGSRFRCPHCGNAFAAPSSAAPTDPPRRSGAWFILAGVVGLALFLLVGAGVVLFLHFLPQKTETAPVAAAPPRAPGDNADNSDPVRDNTTPSDAPPAPKPPEPPWLPPEEQEKVNAAVDRGVAFLEARQFAGGTWDFTHQTGMAALPGLTLLECGVSPDDPHIRKAAQFVRGAAPNLNTTYELALAILFLDRLGDPKDEPLIRTMALRLTAGQLDSGGWNYDCPVLSPKDEEGLSTLLQATRPLSSLDLTASRTGGEHGIDALLTGQVGRNTAQGAAGPTDEEVKQAKRVYGGLTPNLKRIPALQPPTDENQISRGDNSDNSNTQFAALGLWAAGRHGAATERSLALLSRRFQVSQTAHGGWDYHHQYQPKGGPDTPDMTGAGLLGLAVGHGVTAGLKGADAETEGEDPKVEKGMTALADYIRKMKNLGYLKDQQAGLYFLWSVERVGMLYGRRAMDGKEWYPWGAHLLLPAQKSDGSWSTNGYYGATPITDTSFALLFLKRANLAQDLTTKVQFLTQIKKP
jgi:hypothetical protein